MLSFLTSRLGKYLFHRDFVTSQFNGMVCIKNVYIRSIPSALKMLDGSDENDDDEDEFWVFSLLFTQMVP